MAQNKDVIIIGAGLAGLACAVTLQNHGVTSTILEATDTVGGRIKTDHEQGFLLDRGFQVLLTAYPEAQRFLDYNALDLHQFDPGAMVFIDGKFYKLADPIRQPKEALAGIAAPIGSLADKMKVVQCRLACARSSIHTILSKPETSTLQALKNFGFSPVIIERFLRPFFRGVFLDRDLSTSSRKFEFVFRMFALGNASLPAQGMQAIATHLASKLPPDSIRFGSKVKTTAAGRVKLESGETLSAQSVVIATEFPEAGRLLGKPFPFSWQSTTCIYFVAPAAPIPDPILILNGEGCGPVNNVCFPSQVSHTYSSGAMTLVSVSVLGLPIPNSAELLQSVTDQLRRWFGPTVKSWQHLKTYVIPHALPTQPNLDLKSYPGYLRPHQGLYVCGDYCDIASINGALRSGRLVADLVAAEAGQV